MTTLWIGADVPAFSDYPDGFPSMSQITDPPFLSRYLTAIGQDERPRYMIGVQPYDDHVAVDMVSAEPPSGGWNVPSAECFPERPGARVRVQDGGGSLVYGGVLHRVVARVLNPRRTETRPQDILLVEPRRA